jgi:hypothetical protein
LAIGDWRLTIDDWRLAIGDWRLTIEADEISYSLRQLRTTTDRQLEGISIVNHKSSIVNRLLTCGKMPFFDVLDKPVHP